MNQKLLVLFYAILLSFFAQRVVAATTGDKTPDCKLKPFDAAASFNVEALHGKVLYLDFWASWCGPCAKSFPFMVELQRELKGKGIELIGINLDENLDDAKAFLAKYPVNFTIAADSDGNCAEKYGVKAMPSSYLIGRDGIIRHVHLGFRPGEAKDLRELVDQLLAEKATTH